MKRTVFIGLLLLLALASCHGPWETQSKASLDIVVSPEPQSPQRSQLMAIDSLLWQQPNTALAVLMEYLYEGGDTARPVITEETFNRHYANLLLSELLYKNDYAQTNRPALRQALAYFDSLVRQAPPSPPLQRGAGGFKTRPGQIDQTAFLAARAHYINGVGYYENDSAVPACREYLKALEIMEGRFEEKEMIKEKANFMAMTYTRLTVLFSNLYLNKQAIYFGKLSLPYYERNKTSPWHLPWMLSKIGAHYNVMDELDSADYYFQQAKVCLSDTMSQMYRDIVVHQALLSYQMEHQSAKPLMVLHRIADLAVSDDERLARYLSIADIYYNERLFDSAKIYFEQVYCNTKIPDSKMFALDMLRNISMTEGDTLKANEYALARSQFTTEKDKEGRLHSDLTTLCQNHEQSRQEAQHRLKTQKAARRWGIALVLAAFVVSVVSLLLVILRRRMRTEQYSHKMEQAALSGRLKRSNEALRDVTQQFEQAVAKTAVAEETETFDDYVAFMNVPVCQHIIRLVHKQQFKSKVDYLNYKDDALSKEQLLALRDAAEKHLVRFTSHIRKQFPNLTEGDMDYCYLFLLGLKEADISALIQRAYSTVCERSRKINRIIEAKGDLYHTLRNMLFE